MLTRLRVNGFKNLVDVDIHFGPFTCIAGANGSGKSNLFDALHFLGALADGTLMDAALSVREGSVRAQDIQNLFLHVADWYAPRMSFEAEMIVPREVTDDLGQNARAEFTFLRYELVLTLSHDAGVPGLRIEREELSSMTMAEASGFVYFPHSSQWRDSVLHGRRAWPLISTESGENGNLIRVHQDGRQGRIPKWLASTLPRTVISVSSTTENPSILAARREMQSWRLLQLEASALRRPDEFTAPARMASNGLHVPAVLYRLIHQQPATAETGKDANGANIIHSGQVYARIANRLNELVEDIRGVYIERDIQRELLTLYATTKEGTAYAAKSLSDGALRFLALTVMELDSEAQGVLCLEEPENGIHPNHIPAMIRLLKDIACDTQEPVDPYNPLRQVIINTHSPAVVAEVPEGSLLLARLIEHVDEGRRYRGPQFCCLSETWRANAGQSPIITKGEMLAYLQRMQPYDERDDDSVPAIEDKRVADRQDLLPLPFPVES